MDLGIYPERGSKKLEGGIFKVSELLSLVGEHPRLMTFRYNPSDPKQLNKRMDYLLFEKRSYHFPDPRKAIQNERTPSQKPVDKDDHMMENERRIVEWLYEYDAQPVEIVDAPRLTYKGQRIDVDFQEDIDEFNEEMDEYYGS